MEYFQSLRKYAEIDVLTMDIEIFTTVQSNHGIQSLQQWTLCRNPWVVWDILHTWSIPQSHYGSSGGGMGWSSFYGWGVGAIGLTLMTRLYLHSGL